MGGKKCFNNNSCSGNNAVFRINERKDDKKELLPNRCKNYFLFDKAVDDDDDDKGDDDKNKRVTLHDMCPKQCKVKECIKK